MAKIHIFTNHYDPENFRINQISSALSKRHKVKVVTQVPNYPQGSFFTGYSWFKKRKEVKNGLEIQRLPVIPRGNNLFMLMLNYTSYIISSFFYSVFSKAKPDYVFVYVTSPIFISWAGLRVAKRHQVPSTLYLLDLWPAVFYLAVDVKNRYVRRFVEKMTIKIYDSFDRIIVSSYSFGEVLEAYGIDSNKISYLPQHAEKVKQRQKRPNNEIFQIIFTGNIGHAQGLDILVETALELKVNQIDNVLFKIVGDGRYKNNLLENISRLDVAEYFEFTGRVTPDKIASLLSQADLGFVSLIDDEALNRTLPVKVQTYMAHGIPVLASANGQIPWIIERSQAGISVPANNVDKLYETILKYRSMSHEQLEQFSINGFNYAKVHFDKEELISEVEKIIISDV